MRVLLFPLLAVSLCAAEAPKLRVPGDVHPTKYAAELTLVPGATTFDGSIDIDISVVKPTFLIWLNATDLSIAKASFKGEPAAVEPGNDDFIGLRLPAEAPAGPATLHIQYKGKISPNNSAGIFQGKDGGETYLYTQFESTDARRAFPCFDEPDFKTPWQLTLHVRKSDRAFSNTPQLSETDEPDGMKRVVFAQTKPLPSYLVAAAVGPFEVVDAGTAGRNHVPVRIIAPKGKAGWTKYAAEVTPTIVQRLEDYFGVPFPYEKIDNVAIAVNAGFAMENAGMVTYDQNIILSDPAFDSINRQRSYASVAAHELAHQWFGDLVTTAWWDDIWLNEAFATWTSSKILAGWKPEWKTRLSDLNATIGAMANDQLLTARQIRQPIESKDDISNAFDGITYQKGAAVIRMFEVWVGEQQFQQGVHNYLTRYAYKNARAGDFLDSIASAGRPELTRAFSTFLDQPGFPEIAVELECDGAPRVKLSQTRFLPIGSTGKQDQLWQTPVCVRYDTGSGYQRECFLLDTRSAEFKLSKANSCPAYLSANDAATGYYRTSYQGDLLAKVVNHAASFPSIEQKSLLVDLSALAHSGQGKLSSALQVAQTFANSPERQVSGEARSIVGGARDLVPANLRPNYERYVQKLFGAQARELGWTAKPGDDADTRLLRSSLVPFVARQGNDAALRAEALRLAQGWLKTRKGVDPDMLSAVLTTAAASGGQDLFDAMVAAFKDTKDPRQRGIIINAISSFRDPKMIRQALAMFLDTTYDVRETLGLLFAGTGEAETQKMPLEFLKANYDAIANRLPSAAGEDYRSYLLYLGSGFCDAGLRKEYVGFFENKAKDYLGGPRMYAQTLEQMRVCEDYRAAQRNDVAAFFEKQ
jgi:alanyl aminopeptidase